MRLLTDVFHAFDLASFLTPSIVGCIHSLNSCSNPLALLTALLWLRSFLTDRSLSVIFGPKHTVWLTFPMIFPRVLFCAAFLHVYSIYRKSGWDSSFPGCFVPSVRWRHSSVSSALIVKQILEATLSSGLIDVLKATSPKFWQDLGSFGLAAVSSLSRLIWSPSDPPQVPRRPFFNLSSWPQSRSTDTFLCLTD